MSKTKCEDVMTIQGEVYIRKGSIEEAKVNRVKSVEKHPFTIGKQWLFQTPTLYWVGDIVAVTPTEIVLERAAWIPDTGRFNEFMATGNPKECEPVQVPVIINRGGYINALPTKEVKMEIK